MGETDNKDNENGIKRNASVDGKKLIRRSAIDEEEDNVVDNPAKKKPDINLKPIIVIVVIVILVILYVFSSVKKSQENAERAKANRDAAAATSEATKKMYASDDFEEMGVNSVSAGDEVAALDTFVLSVKPGERIDGLEWNSDLFYWFENINSADDGGYKSKCEIFEYEIMNNQTQRMSEYYVYKDKESSEIYKIISIEDMDGVYNITDYYYLNGEPNFVFFRTNTDKSIAYATTDISGERYYFAQNVMVRWRSIDREGKVTDRDYSEADSEYDAAEINMLNAAINVYNAILNYE